MADEMDDRKNRYDERELGREFADPDYSEQQQLARSFADPNALDDARLGKSFEETNSSGKRKKPAAAAACAAADRPAEDRDLSYRVPAAVFDRADCRMAAAPRTREGD